MNLHDMLVRAQSMASGAQAAPVNPIYGGMQHRIQSNSGNTNPFFRNGEFNTNQGLQSLLGGAYAAGSFDPTGNGAYLEAMRRYLSQVGAGNMRQAQLGAQMYSPDDPMMAAYARMNAEQHSRDTLQQQLGQAQAGAAGDVRNFDQNLLMGYMQPTLTQRPRTDWGAVGGQVAGTVLGGLVGRGGGS